MNVYSISLSKRNRGSIHTIFTAVHLGVVRQASHRVVCSLGSHDLLHELLLLFFLSGRETGPLPLLLVEHLLEVTLRLQVKFLNPLTVVYFLGINLVIAKNHTFPYSFVSLLEVDVEVLVVLHTPECVIYLDLLAELTFDERLVLIALERDPKVLGLDLYVQLLRCRSRRDRNLNIHILNAL